MVATDYSTVKLSISTGPAGAILSGVVSASDISGIATFSNLRLSKAGTYQLKATDGECRCDFDGVHNFVMTIIC